MRKDKGLNGDLDRLPMLTWIMFLKFLDDMEQIREEEAKLEGKRFRPIIDSPYRWRDWAAKPEGITGDDLIAFVNNEEAIRPDGTKGAGLFAYLRGAARCKRRRPQGCHRHGFQRNNQPDDQRLPASGRDQQSQRHPFHVAATKSTRLGHLYESCSKRCATLPATPESFTRHGRSSGSWLKPSIPGWAKTILDPACGTGGFLVEPLSIWRNNARLSRIGRSFKPESIFGGEAKPLPYLLGQMNLVLHGLESPRSIHSTALRFPLREIGDKDRVDIIMTNPPFGGEEEKWHPREFSRRQANLRNGAPVPATHHAQTPAPAQTAWPPGRGRCAQRHAIRRQRAVGRIKEELLKDFNLHTIVRLPNGVFAPYTAFPTNLLFFDRSGRRRSLVLRTAPSRRPEELHQNSADSIRGIRGLPEVVE